MWEVWRAASPPKTLLFPCGGGTASATREKGDSGEAAPPQTPPLRKVSYVLFSLRQQGTFRFIIVHWWVAPRMAQPTSEQQEEIECSTRHSALSPQSSALSPGHAALPAGTSRTRAARALGNTAARRSAETGFRR